MHHTRTVNVNRSSDNRRSKTAYTFRTDQRYSLGWPGSALDRGWITVRVPDDSEDDRTRDVLPVQLGVTFKW